MDYINEDLMQYLNKLVKTIETQSSFEFGNVRILEQNRIDDILCCIDINFPKLLHKFKKAYAKDTAVQSFNIYRKLISNLKVKPPLTKNKYAVNYAEVVALVDDLKHSFVEDIAYICKKYPNLLEDD